MRPLSHFYRTALDLPMSFENIICHSPEPAAGKPLYQLTDDNLNCVNVTESMLISDLDVLPDLAFREIYL